MSSSFNVYAIDLPGFGKSDIGVPLSVEEVTEIVHKFILEMKIEKPIILGHSYGGRVAIVYASKYPVD